jgi:N-acetylglucosamine-6-sulfatase
MFISNIRFRTWQVLAIGVVLAALMGKHLVTASGGQRPAAGALPSDAKLDIITIMADDLDIPSLNVALANGFMPNLQTSIINAGTTFQNSFVSNSICCPSRATFLTGQYPHNTGVQSNGSQRGGCTALHDNSTLAVWLRSAGYRTGLVGKYLNLYGSKGAEETQDCLNQYYIPPGWDDWQALLDPWTYLMYGYKINDNKRIVSSEYKPSDYQTDVLAQRASRFIQDSAQNSSVPMFLLVAPPIPHFSNIVPAGCSTNFGTQETIPPAPRDVGTAASIPLTRGNSYNESDINDKPAFYQQFALLTPAGDACMQKLFRDRLGSLRALDKLIGTVVQTLQSVQRLDRTVLIFTSDNGFLLGQHRLMHKGWPYEDSIRVPLYIRAPGVPAQSSSLFALNNDLAPTILDFAQAFPTMLIDGSSLRDVLKNPATTDWRKRILSEWFNFNQSNALTVSPLTDFIIGGLRPPDANWYPPTYSLVRTSADDLSAPNTSYIEYVEGSREFYDLVQDPDQLQNLGTSAAAARSAQMTILSQWIAALQNCSNGRCQILERASLPQ